MEDRDRCLSTDRAATLALRDLSAEARSHLVSQKTAWEHGSTPSGRGATASPRALGRGCKAAVRVRRGLERLHPLRASVHALFAAFMTEARTRAAGTIPELDAYLRVREQTVGLHVEFALGKIVEAIDLSYILAVTRRDGEVEEE